MSRFVDTKATDEITLSNGDKVWTRQKLTAAEQVELEKAIVTVEVDVNTMRAKDVRANWSGATLHIVTAYLVDWDFTDVNGVRVPFDKALIGTLGEETIKEISKGIDLAQTKRQERAEGNASKS